MGSVRACDQVVDVEYVGGPLVAQLLSVASRKRGGEAVGSAGQPWTPMSTADTKRAMHTTTVATSAGNRQREGTTGILLSGTGPSEPSWRTSSSLSSLHLPGDCAASASHRGRRGEAGEWD